MSGDAQGGDEPVVQRPVRLRHVDRLRDGLDRAVVRYLRVRADEVLARAGRAVALVGRRVDEVRHLQVHDREAGVAVGRDRAGRHGGVTGHRGPGGRRGAAARDHAAGAHAVHRQAVEGRFLQGLDVVAPDRGEPGVVLALRDGERLTGRHRAVQVLGVEGHQPLGVGDRRVVAVPEAGVADQLALPLGLRLRPVEGLARGRGDPDVGHAHAGVAAQGEQHGPLRHAGRQVLRGVHDACRRPPAAGSGRSGRSARSPAARC